MDVQGLITHPRTEPNTGRLYILTLSCSTSSIPEPFALIGTTSRQRRTRGEYWESYAGYWPLDDSPNSGWQSGSEPKRKSVRQLKGGSGSVEGG